MIVKPSQLWVSVAYLCQTTKDWIPSSHLRFRIMIRVIRVNSNIADHERVRGRPQHLKLTIVSSITQYDLDFFILFLSYRMHCIGYFEGKGE